MRFNRTVLAVVLLLAAHSTVAEAMPWKTRKGVHVNPRQGVTVAQLKKANVGSVRIYTAARAGPEYRRATQLAAKLKAAGIRPQPYFEYAGTRPTNREWTDRMQAWSEAFPEGTRMEVGNEPDRPGQVGIARAMELHRLAAPILRRRHQRVILAAAMSGNKKELVAAAVKAGLFADGLVDGIALHVYPPITNPRNAADQIRGIRAIQGVPKQVGLFISEMGWGTSRPYTGSASMLVGTVQAQAAAVTAVYDALWAIRNGANPLRLIGYFAWRDTGADFWGLTCGLHFASGAAKPSLAAFSAQPAFRVLR
jgi:hypothetical protein